MTGDDKDEFGLSPVPPKRGAYSDEERADIIAKLNETFVNENFEPEPPHAA